MTVRMTQLVALAWLILALGLVAPAVGSSDQVAALVEGARKEGRVVVYHAPVITDVRMILDRFSRKYPYVTGEQYRASSVSLVNRIMTEGKVNARKWDVVIVNSMFLQQLKKLGHLQKFIARERGAYDKGFRDEEGYWNGMFINTHVVGYNTRLVSRSDVPKSYMELLDPKWRGKMAIESEPYEWLAGLEKEWGKKEKDEYLKKLAEQKLTIRQGRSLLTQLLAAGEFHLVIAVYAYNLERMKRQGAPVDWLGLDPVIVNLLGIGLANTPANPNAAQLFMEFALSKDGQSVVKEFGRIPARLEIEPNPPSLTRGIKLVPSDPNLGDEIGRVLKEFDANFIKQGRNLF